MCKYISLAWYLISKFAPHTEYMQLSLSTQGDFKTNTACETVLIIL